ncbi:MAG TPA: uroporphyrinogen-III C-methyltransferase [Gammaproteobacteria bacterium]|nr:uroporphyrinogen-III C-methyltransferase [Gammaproteobacteria bacterium]
MSEHKPPQSEQSPAGKKASDEGSGSSTSKSKQGGSAAGAEARGGKGREAGGKPPASGAQPPRSAAQAPKPAASRPGAAGRVALPLSVLALLIGIGTAVAGYFIWHEVTRLDQAQQSGVDRLQSAVKGLRSSVDDQQRHLTRQLSALKSRQDSVEAGVARLRSEVSRSSEGWVLANVQYLLQVANESLQLQRDVGAAKAALQDADERLKTLGDPGYLPVRKAIASELTALDAVPVPDIAGITVTLDSLIHQVPQLTLPGAAAAKSAAKTGAATASAPGAGGVHWRELPAVVWKALRQLVQVRHHEKPVGPLLAPRNEYFLYQNMKLQLEAAQLAALRHQPKSYQASLSTARQWLNQYFVADNALTQSMAQQLKDLQSINVRPKLPDLSGSLRKLRRLRAAMEQQQGSRPERSGAPQPAKTASPGSAASGTSDSGSGATGSGQSSQQPAAGGQ